LLLTGGMKKAVNGMPLVAFKQADGGGVLPEYKRTETSDPRS
jgi:hypothetical protein